MISRKHEGPEDTFSRLLFLSLAFVPSGAPSWPPHSLERPFATVFPFLAGSFPPLFPPVFSPVRGSWVFCEGQEPSSGAS